MVNPASVDSIGALVTSSVVDEVVVVYERLDVLLIEDSVTQALQFQLVLQRRGYRVFITTDGAEGWRRACTHPPRLILLDVDLPTLDGFQVLARLKRDRATAGIPVVMLTHHDHVSNVERAIALGAVGYLFKDEGPQQVCAVVRQLLAASDRRTSNICP